MRTIVGAVVGATCLIWLATSPWAASLQVSPVSIEVPAPGAATTITLHNVGTDPLNAQIRVFRWFQTNGDEKLEPTDDVIASPPIATLAPNRDYTVRVVRVSKQPITTGESYRLLVDELPDAVSGQSRTVRLVMRYSVPVFFYPNQTAEPKLAWSLEERGGSVFLLATNSGDRHVRLASLKLQEGTTTVASFGDGLLGYVLGHSAMRWQIPGNPQQLSTGRPIAISAQGDIGPIDAALAAPRAH